jgi:hypothetical protein
MFYKVFIFYMCGFMCAGIPTKQPYKIDFKPIDYNYYTPTQTI